MKTCAVCDQEVTPQMIRQGGALSRGAALYHRDCHRLAQPGSVRTGGRAPNGSAALAEGTSFPDIPVAVEYASFWRRFGAHAIDGFILNAVIIGMSLALGLGFGMAGNGEATFGSVLGGIIGLVGPIAYFIFFWSKDGATPGKKALGIRVVNNQDEPPSKIQCFIRYIGYIVSSLPFCLGYLWMLWDNEKRTWHDMMSGTRVTRI